MPVCFYFRLYFVRLSVAREAASELLTNGCYLYFGVNATSIAVSIFVVNDRGKQFFYGFPTKSNVFRTLAPSFVEIVH